MVLEKINNSERVGTVYAVYVGLSVGEKSESKVVADRGGPARRVI